MDELEHFIGKLDKKPQIIIITESWIKKGEEKFFCMQNYCSIFSSRIDCRGGGIVVYIHDGFPFDEKINFQIEKNHVILLCDLNVSVCAIYRSPSTNINQFLKYMDELLENNEQTIICGDINIDLLNTNSANVTSYNQILLANGFHCINEIDKTQYTYSCGDHYSILDHVCTNILNIEHNLKILPVAFSDHRLLQFNIKVGIKEKINNDNKIIKIVNYENIKLELIQYDDMNKSYDEFAQFLISVYNNNITEKTFIEKEGLNHGLIDKLTMKF